jgi:hypothetical protein
MADALNPFGNSSAMPKEEIKDFADWAGLITRALGEATVEAAFVPFKIADRLATGAYHFLRKVLGAFVAERSTENPIVKGFAQLACKELESGREYGVSIEDVNAIREGRTPPEYDSARSFIDFCHQSGNMEWGEVIASGYKFQRVESSHGNQYAIYQGDELVTSFEFDLDGRLLVRNSFSENHPLKGNILSSNAQDAEQSWSLIASENEAQREISALEKKIAYSQNKELEPAIKQKLEQVYLAVGNLQEQAVSAFAKELTAENPYLGDVDVREVVVKSLEQAANKAAGRGDFGGSNAILEDISDILQANIQDAISEEQDDLRDPRIKNVVGSLSLKGRESQRLLRLNVRISAMAERKGNEELLAIPTMETNSREVSDRELEIFREGLRNISVTDLDGMLDIQTREDEPNLEKIAVLYKEISERESVTINTILSPLATDRDWATAEQLDAEVEAQEAFAAAAQSQQVKPDFETEDSLAQ